MDPKELLSLLGYPATAPPQGGIVDPFTQSGMSVEDPFQTPTQPAPVQEPPTKASVSDAGFSPKKFAQVEQATKGVPGQIAAARRGAEQRFAPVLDQVNQNTAAADQALDQVSTAEQDVIAAKARNSAALSKQQADFQRDEELAWADANAAAEAAKQEYNAKLLEIPLLNSSQLWDSAGNEGQFGMAAAAFLHDFLGAKGIKTSAMDTMKSAIDRNIDGQIANINNKRATAQGFKDLWEMTRAQSASDTEARTRMRGFALASLQAELDSQLGSYDSALAAAKHQLAKAQLAKEQQKNLMDVYKAVEDSAAHEASQIITMRGQSLQAAQHKESMALQRELAALKAKGDKGKTQMFVHDPETGKGRWVFKEGVTEAVQMKKLEEVGHFETANKKMNEIRALARQAETQVFDPFKGTRFSTEQQRKYDAMVTDFAHAMVAARGERPTDRDVIQALKLLPQETTFMRGGVQEILASTQEYLNEATQSQLRQFVDDVPEEEQPQGASGRIAEGSFTDATITSKNEPKDATQARNEKIDQQLTTPAAYEDEKLRPLAEIKKIAEQAVNYPEYYKMLEAAANKKAPQIEVPDVQGRGVLTDLPLPENEQLIKEYAAWELAKVNKLKAKK